MPLVWSLGSIFGPSFGGFFAKPAENLSGLFGNSWLFIKYPFLLPNMVASSLFLIGITTGILFLKVKFLPLRYYTPSITVTNIHRKPSKQNVTVQIMVVH